MPSKVSILWAICGGVEYALQPLRWFLLFMAIAGPWLDKEQLLLVVWAWAGLHLLDRGVAGVLRHLLPDDELLP